MAKLKYYNQETGQWESAGSGGGVDGKSAYAYAKEGGYTGTEAEFAAALGEVCSKDELVQAVLDELTNAEEVAF